MPFTLSTSIDDRLVTHFVIHFVAVRFVVRFVACFVTRFAAHFVDRSFVTHTNAKCWSIRLRGKARRDDGVSPSESGE